MGKVNGGRNANVERKFRKKWRKSIERETWKLKEWEREKERKREREYNEFGKKDKEKKMTKNNGEKKKVWKNIRIIRRTEWRGNSDIKKNKIKKNTRIHELKNRKKGREGGDKIYIIEEEA